MMIEDKKASNERSAADRVVLSIAIAAWLLVAFTSLKYFAFFEAFHLLHLPLAVSALSTYAAVVAFRKRRIMRSMAYAYLGFLYLLPAIFGVYLEYVRYWIP